MINFVFSKEELNVLSQLNLDEINKNELRDVSQMMIDMELPKRERILKFLENINNPYCFLMGSNVIKMEFSDNGKSLQTLLEKHFIEQRNCTFE